jgi:NAD(P)-dependent dehydrogenase (short-subunit alcohol dehydrogenase family)
MTIEGKAVPVTGANRGIGLAPAAEALVRGAKRVYAGTRQPMAHPDARVTPLMLDVTSTICTGSARHVMNNGADSTRSLDRSAIFPGWDIRAAMPLVARSAPGRRGVGCPLRRLCMPLPPRCGGRRRHGLPSISPMCFTPKP